METVAHRKMQDTPADDLVNDFNNIITIIQSNMEVALGKSPEHLRGNIQRVLAATERCKELVSRLLHFNDGKLQSPSKHMVAKGTQKKVYGGTEAILLIDDEHDILFAAAERLKELGYTVLLAESGEEARDILRSGQVEPDLIVLDHAMPGLTGLDVLSEIRRLNTKPSVIVCSGSDLRHFKDYEGVPHIKKPFNLNTLSETVWRVLGSRKENLRMTCLNRLRLYAVAENISAHKKKIKNSDDVYKLFRNIACEARETFIALLLDAAGNVIGYSSLSTGTTDRVAVHPKEVVRLALMANARSVILVHNHPSGDLRPSQEDLISTAAVMQACNVMDLKLLDHIIISSQGYLSISERGLLGPDP